MPATIVKSVEPAEAPQAAETPEFTWFGICYACGQTVVTGYPEIICPHCGANSVGDWDRVVSQ